MNPAPSERLAGRRILLGVTGGIAAYKAAELVRLYKKAGADVQVLMTRDAARFITPLTLGTLSEREVLTEIFPDNESGSWTKHVHLGRWADAFVVAPATANTLAKMAGGFCDSMLTAVYLSATCPVMACPAMDHDMFEHPATRRNLAALRADGVRVIEPAHGELASGLVGRGRLPEPPDIVAFTIELLEKQRKAGPLAGKTVLVSAGPTRERIDPVRFLSNHSTGTMGFMLAEAAALLGGDVTLVAGPSACATPAGVSRVDVESAADMAEAVLARKNADLVIMAAAVADYRPAQTSDHKLKKSEGDLQLKLERTTDILAEVGASKTSGQTLVGFALETHDGDANAQAKLSKKHLDWIVLNNPNEEGAGFGTGTNRVSVIGKDGSRHEIPVAGKRDVARAILKVVVG